MTHTHKLNGRYLVPNIPSISVFMYLYYTARILTLKYHRYTHTLLYPITSAEVTQLHYQI